MAESESVYSKVPVEIWEQIFRGILGPSLTDTNQISLRDYNYMLHARDSVLMWRYKYSERKRGILRLVSRHWKGIADQMRDNIIFLHLETGYRMPPNIDTLKAKCICILSSASELLETPSNKTHFFPVTDRPLLIDATQAEMMAFSIFHVGFRDIDVYQDGQIDTPAFGTTIYALNWTLSTDTSSLESLTAGIFQNLLAISLNLTSDTPRSAQDPALFFPKVRYLHLYVYYTKFDIISDSFFPSLRFLDLHKTFRCDVDNTCDSVTAFLLKHAKTIEELNLPKICQHHSLATCLKDLPRLREYVVPDIESLAKALSYLDTMETNPWFTLQIEDPFVVECDEEAVAQSLRKYSDVAGRIVIKMKNSWEDLKEQIRECGLYLLQTRWLGFIRVLDAASIRIFDWEGNLWGGEKANNYARSVRARIADLEPK